MRRYGTAAAFAACVWMAGISAVQAADTWPVPGYGPGPGLFNQVPAEISLTLSGRGLDMTIEPRRIYLTAGSFYQLTITNNSQETHFFWAPAFAGFAAEMRVVDVRPGNLWTRIGGPPGEEYTTPEVEIGPGGVAVLEILPVLAGQYKAGCSNPKHHRSGMKVEFVVTPGELPLG